MIWYSSGEIRELVVLKSQWGVGILEVPFKQNLFGVVWGTANSFFLLRCPVIITSPTLSGNEGLSGPTNRLQLFIVEDLFGRRSGVGLLADRRSAWTSIFMAASTRFSSSFQPRAPRMCLLMTMVALLLGKSVRYEPIWMSNSPVVVRRLLADLRGEWDIVHHMLNKDVFLWLGDKLILYLLVAALSSYWRITNLALLQMPPKSFFFIFL